MSKISMELDTAKELKKYIEEKEVLVEEHWAVGRSLEQLKELGHMPSVYDELCALIDDAEECAKCV